MGLLDGLLDVVINGLVAVSSDKVRTGAAPTATIERLCLQIGWSIDERESNAVILHFNDPIIRVRKLVINCAESGKIAVLSVRSASSLSARQVHPDIMAHLLMRNAEMVSGAWQA